MHRELEAGTWSHGVTAQASVRWSPTEYLPLLGQYALITVALTAIGIWLAVSIADLRKTQDCVLMGRRDCARISTTHF